MECKPNGSSTSCDHVAKARTEKVCKQMQIRGARMMNLLDGRLLSIASRVYVVNGK
jgi:hypothetical protein